MVSTGLYDLSYLLRDESYILFRKKRKDWITFEMKDSESRIDVFPTLSNWESCLLLGYFLIEPSR